MRIIFFIIFLRVIGAGVLSYHKSTILIDWVLLNLNSVRIELAFILDSWSLIFSFTVSAITGAVLLFSRSYMAQEKFFLRFHILVLLFVFSIILLIFSPNLFSLLLGWDGLGVTSYLLVIYFQRRKSYNAGSLTAFTNRIGDVLIIVALSLSLILGTWKFSLWSIDSRISRVFIIIVVLAARTKRAQVPFSAWLPAAIAAPTPVSSLVHSSTLVTAGVYLLARFRDIFIFRFNRGYLLYLGSLTILLAGFRALWEIDIKKIIALSTLSQLGLIFFSLGLGLYGATFIHLLSHAYFKALLFITIGQIIHLSADYQDLRKIGLSFSLFPVSLRFSLIANLSLCGVPFIAGFYSKDYIYELLSLLNAYRGAIGIFLLAVSLTAIYTFRLIYILTLGPYQVSCISQSHDNDPYINSSIIILWPLAILGGAFLFWNLRTVPLAIVLPLEIKNSLLVIFFISILYSVISSKFLFRLISSSWFWGWGIIWNLPFLSSPIFRFIRLFRGNISRKLDISWFYFLTLAATPKERTFLKDRLLNNTQPLKSLLFLSFTLLIVLLIVYLCI